MNITNEQALNNLYIASGKAPLTRDEHAVVQISKQILESLLKKQNPIANDFNDIIKKDEVKP